MELQSCESQEALEQLAMTFTASRANFGALETVELERGGEGREVTLENKAEFVNKLYKWHLTGMSPWHGTHINFKEDLGWFSVLMLIGVHFLPITYRLRKRIINCRHFDYWAAVFLMMSALKKTASR